MDDNRRWRRAGGRGVGSGVTGRGADCVDGDALIQTSSGAICARTLYRLQSRPLILACSHATGELEWRRIVTAEERKSDKEIIEIDTTGGRKLRVTGDHRIYVRGGGYRAAALLAPGDELVIVDLPHVWRRKASGEQDVQAVLLQGAQADG